MEVRRFGSTALQVSELGLGCARIGGIFQNDPKGFLNLLAAARDTGINFYDTADMYSQGESERLIGRAFEGKRDRIVIASKAGYCLPAQRRLAAKLKPLLRPVIRLVKLRRQSVSAAVRGALAQDFSPSYLRSAVEGSLRRLRTDYLDLLQLHSPPADVVAREDWVGALESLKRAGKIRYYGVSCDSVEAGHAALAHEGVSSLQLVVNLLEQRQGDALLPLARARGVAGIARECLANGLLVKEASEIDLATYCSSPDEIARREEQLATLRRRALEDGRPLASLALDYVRSRDGVSVTLVGARTVEQLRTLVAHAQR
jgi:aryl-alcohol dehydrogenase-like predicted oxidoreductase